MNSAIFQYPDVDCVQVYVPSLTFPPSRFASPSPYLIKMKQKKVVYIMGTQEDISLRGACGVGGWRGCYEVRRLGEDGFV